jgi:hypothetical protein
LTALIGLDADVVWYELCKRVPPTPLFSELDQLAAKHQFNYTSQLQTADKSYHIQTRRLYNVIAELENR